MDKQAVCLRLKNILKKGVMSPMLKETVTSTIKALESGDLELAYQITACKSLIVGRIDPEDTRNAFQEDESVNAKLFKGSLYNILDGMHHDLAMSVKKLPSGMSIHSPEGVAQMTHRGEHPVIKRITAEHENIHREVEERYPV